MESMGHRKKRCDTNAAGNKDGVLKALLKGEVVAWSRDVQAHANAQMFVNPLGPPFGGGVF